MEIKFDSMQELREFVETHFELNGVRDQQEFAIDLARLAFPGNQKIKAIKIYRNVTGAKLKEAKEAIEKYWF